MKFGIRYFLEIRISNIINNKKIALMSLNVNLLNLLIFMSLSALTFSQSPIDDDYHQYIENDIAEPTHIEIQK